MFMSTLQPVAIEVKGPVFCRRLEEPPEGFVEVELSAVEFAEALAHVNESLASASAKMKEREEKVVFIVVFESLCVIHR